MLLRNLENMNGNKIGNTSQNTDLKNIQENPGKRIINNANGNNLHHFRKLIS